MLPTSRRTRPTTPADWTIREMLRPSLERTQPKYDHLPLAPTESEEQGVLSMQDSAEIRRPRRAERMSNSEIAGVGALVEHVRGGA
jgi:hypothetical protein